MVDALTRGMWFRWVGVPPGRVGKANVAPLPECTPSPGSETLFHGGAIFLICQTRHIADVLCCRNDESGQCAMYYVLSAEGGRKGVPFYAAGTPVTALR